MIAKDLIKANIIPLKTSDTGLDAIAWMDEYRVSHMPIVNNIDFLGLISEQDVYSLNDPEEPVGNHLLALKRPFILQNQHLYEVIRMFAAQKLTLLPVLDEKNQYLGVITMYDLVVQFAHLTAVENPGGTIILEINQNDYSLSEIAQIVESNDAKILSVYVSSHPDSMKLEVTLKLNKLDIFAILQAFTRYNYIIKASYSEDEYNDFLLDRFDSLMNYLSV